MPLSKYSKIDIPLFSYKSDYETTGWFNGNIGKQSWHNGAAERNYTFAYDNAKRLKSATYTGINGENYSIPNMNYDRNGNITNLQRNGKTGSGFGQIDNLSYSYNGNRLSQITDAIAGNNTVDFVPRGSGDYTYYNDGSLKSDANEQISNILYDSYLQQPIEVQLTDGRKINHYYDGHGKLLKTVYSTGEIWEYADGFIYKNGALYQVQDDEGRILYQNGVFQYEFHYTDHLGNTRVSFKANGNQLEKVAETAFDPWGVVLNGLGQQNATPNRWEYQGKEKESTFGLNRINLGARTVNPTTGIMDRIDPIADHKQQLRFSPYVYANNNPIRFIDPDGRLPGDLYDQKGNKVGKDGIDDGRKYIVVDNKEAKQVSKTTKDGGTTQVGTLTSAVLLPSNAALQEASNVIDRTEANGGFREENSLVMKSGQVIKGSTGPMPTIINGEQVATATLPNLPAGSTAVNVEATIHSHPTQVQIENNMAYPQSATLPSPTDRNTFKNYGTNIIVGRLGQSSVSQNPNGSYAVSHQPLGAVIYNSNTQPQVQLTQKAIQKILKTN